MRYSRQSFACFKFDFLPQCICFIQRSKETLKNNLRANLGNKQVLEALLEQTMFAYYSTIAIYTFHG